MSTADLVLDRLIVKLGQHALVNCLSLQIQRGEVVALVGASGSGKSLTAAALTGSMPPAATTSGALSIAGTDAPLLSRRRPGVAAIRQDSLTALHPLVRIDQQLIPILSGSGSSGARKTAWATAEGMLEDVGLSDPRKVLQSYPMELSGGQRQRVCIAQALASRPSFLIADEPTTALDVVSRGLVLAALRRTAHEGAGVLFITHDVVAAANLCSRVVVIVGGTVVDEGSFEHLAASSAHPYTQTLLGSIPAKYRFEDAPAA